MKTDDKMDRRRPAEAPTPRAKAPADSDPSVHDAVRRSDDGIIRGTAKPSPAARAKAAGRAPEREPRGR